MWFFLGSPETEERYSPSLSRKRLPSILIGPRVSMAMGTKRRDWMISAYYYYYYFIIIIIIFIIIITTTISILFLFLFFFSLFYFFFFFFFLFFFFLLLLLLLLILFCTKNMLTPLGTLQSFMHKCKTVLHYNHLCINVKLYIVLNLFFYH